MNLHTNTLAQSIKLEPCRVLGAGGDGALLRFHTIKAHMHGCEHRMRFAYRLSGSPSFVWIAFCNNSLGLSIFPSSLVTRMWTWLRVYLHEVIARYKQNKNTNEAQAEHGEAKQGGQNETPKRIYRIWFCTAEQKERQAQKKF